MIPRISVNSLIAKSKLHKDVAFILVEGDFDRRVISSFLETNQTTHNVYKIDQLECTGQKNGAKGRIIKICEDNNSQLSKNFFGLIDPDLDHMLGKKYISDRIKMYDYLQLDWYPLSDAKMKSLINATSKNRPTDTRVLQILEIAFLKTQCRGAREQLQPSANLPKFKKYISGEHFDSIKYLQSTANSLKVDINALEDAISTLDTNKSDDHRKRIHIKDFIEATFTLLRSTNEILASSTEETMKTAIRAFLYDTSLSKYSFFKNLSEEIKNLSK